MTKSKPNPREEIQKAVETSCAHPRYAHGCETCNYIVSKVWKIVNQALTTQEQEVRARVLEEVKDWSDDHVDSGGDLPYGELLDYLTKA